VIGGYAAVLHGSPLVTVDADICPDPEPDNLQRLCRALDEVHARLRTATEPEGVPFRCEAALLAKVAMLNLITDNGPFDLSFRPAASNGYTDLVANAVGIDIGGFVIKIAALDDVIRSKEAADREKDRAALPQLYALRDQIQARETPEKKPPKEK
jgi:hypothetical protein